MSHGLAWPAAASRSFYVAAAQRPPASVAGKALRRRPAATQRTFMQRENSGDSVKTRQPAAQAGPLLVANHCASVPANCLTNGAIMSASDVRLPNRFAVRCRHCVETPSEKRLASGAVGEAAEFRDNVAGTCSDRDDVEAALAGRIVVGR